MRSSVETKLLKVGARGSPLSLAQVQEVLSELAHVHPEIDFDLEIVETMGDKDQTTSLRLLEKTDFFTKEIDTALLAGDIRLAIHSAKDLPDPLPKGLAIAAITKGLTSLDALVMRPGETVTAGMTVATSSERREILVRELCEDVSFCDLRGTIGERLKLLENGTVDGVVIAACALIRLGLTDLNTVTLPGEVTPLQGKLAVVVREDDSELLSLFSAIDARTKCLYLGLECPDSVYTKYTHYPVITTVARHPSNPKIAACLEEIPHYTHIIFTSKTSVRALFQLGINVDHIQMIAVGKKTAAELKNPLVAEAETAEGVIKLIEQLPDKDPYFFWPHSSLSRIAISHFLKARGYRFQECILYDTLPFRPAPPPDLTHFDSLFFTSPSTVDAFIQIYGGIPQDKELFSIGPITKEALQLKGILQAL